MSKKQVAENSIRMLNLGPTNWLRTQSVVRAAVDHVFDLGRDTVVISTPLHDYVAVGAGHIPAETVNLSACMQYDLPVITTPFDAPVTFFNMSALCVQFVLRSGAWNGTVKMLTGGLFQGLEACGLSDLEAGEPELRVAGRPLVSIQQASFDGLLVVQHLFYFQYDATYARQLGVKTDFAGLWTQLKSPASPDMILNQMLAAYAAQLDRPIDRGTPKQRETRMSKEIDLQLIDEAKALLESELTTNANH